jgi:hypothetical protein
MRYRVVSEKFTDISEELAASIFGAEEKAERSKN